MARVVTDLRQMLIRHEGLRLKPYTDTVGKMTIGVGRNLSDVGISEDEAMAMLEVDIDRALNACASSFPFFAALDSVRQDVLVDMCFNMGINGLKNFARTLGLVAQGDYDNAAREMLKSRWAIQVGQRAADLARMMKEGAYQ